VPVGVFPVGIDPEKFDLQLKQDSVAQKIEQYEKIFEGKKVTLPWVLLINRFYWELID
jgi:trehalose-6-phosphate synthase